ncbi:MAG: hypothetical protein LBK29_04190 [Oscillospiraceae bacterium]|jgi:hypothetical protein|nr:hypothetical protein [Oscillospiraceae bacterium]
MATNMISQIFSRVTSSVQTQINSLTKWTLKLQSFGSQFVQKIQEKINKFVQSLMKKPSSKSDYLRFLGFYLSKKFVVMMFAGIGAVCYLYVSFFMPMLEGKLWAAKIRIDSIKFQQFSGKAKVYDTGGNFIYDGEMNSGQPKGFGIQYATDGRKVYKGNFLQGQYDDQGELYDNSENVIYSGYFKNSKFEGPGKQMSSFGTVTFIGNFEKGNRSGRGTEYDAQSGALKYYGEFVSDKREGRGIEYDQKGEISYEGDFKEGVYNGKGKKYNDGHLIYSGSFTNGKYSGEGLLYDESSGVTKYSGEFENGNYNGFGRLHDTGTMAVIYEGEFKNGKRDGEGISYDSLGNPVFSGKFSEDGIDYFSALGKNADEIREKFGNENSRFSLKEKQILIYSSLDLAVTFKSEEENLICEKFILGVKHDFRGLGARNTAAERRSVLGEAFSSINLKTTPVHQKVFKLLGIILSSSENIYTDKYIFDKYFIRLIFSGKDREEVRAIEIGKT